MSVFLEDQILPSTYNYGATITEAEAVDVTGSADGTEARRLRYPDLQKIFDVTYDLNSADAFAIMNLWARANGKYKGFRVHDPLDFSTNRRVLAPTYHDQFLAATASPTVWQMQRIYGWDDDVLNGFLNADSARRMIYKPVSATALVGVYDTTSHLYTQLTVGTDYTVDYTTGLVTISASLTGKRPTFGVEFDIPCRFDSKPQMNFANYGTVRVATVKLLELLNP